MPELPEVETIVRDLNEAIVGKKIKNIEIRMKKIVRNTSGYFLDTLVGAKITTVRRRAKFLIFELDKKNKFLLVHLRMTGQLIYQSKDKFIAGGHEQGNEGKLPNKYTHVIFIFQDGSKLYYNDLRQFGFLRLVDSRELEKEMSNFGIEPLSPEFTFDIFQKLVKGRKTSIKVFLLDQKHIAGLGNIYADEVLFESGVLPTRKLESLNTAELKKIYQAIRKILRKAIIRRGTTFSDYRDASGKKGNFSSILSVYGRKGQPCLKCKKEIIQKTKTAGRGTYFCSGCQR